MIKCALIINYLQNCYIYKGSSKSGVFFYNLKSLRVWYRLKQSPGWSPGCFSQVSQNNLVIFLVPCFLLLHTLHSSHFLFLWLIQCGAVQFSRCSWSADLANLVFCFPYSLFRLQVQGLVAFLWTSWTLLLFPLVLHIHIVQEKDIYHSNVQKPKKHFPPPFLWLSDEHIRRHIKFKFKIIWT